MTGSLKAIAVGLAGLLLVLPRHGHAAAPPWVEGFESFPAGTTLSSLSGAGWGATSNGVVIQSDIVWSPVLGTNAVLVPPLASASNVVVSVDLTNVWFDLYVTNSSAMNADLLGPENVDTNVSVQWFFETNGYPVVWHPASNAWLVCSNDYWGTPDTVFNTNPWMRVSVCMNYSNKTAALFLNQHLMLEEVRFVDTNKTRSARVQVDGGYAVTSCFDQVAAMYAPTNLPLDLDHDGIADADEIQSAGNVDTIRRLVITLASTNATDGGMGGGWPTRPATNLFDIPWTLGATNVGWSASNGFYAADLVLNGVSVGAFTGQYTNSASYTYANSQNDATVTVAFARKPAISTSVANVGGPGSAGCALTASTNEVYPGGAVTFTLTADKAYYVSALKTNGMTAVTFGGQSAVATTTITNIRANLAAQGVFTYTGLRIVPNDYATPASAMGSALAGDQVVVTAGTYGGDVTVADRVSMTGTNVTMSGNLTVGVGTTGTLAVASGWTVGGISTVNGLLVVSNGTVNLGTVVIGSGGTVQVVNATALVVNGLTRSGSFILDASWMQVRAQTPPFSDDFERYGNGTVMAQMGYYGWGTPDNGVVAQSVVVTQGTRAVELPVNTMLSNSLAPTVVSNIWVEYYFKETGRIDESTVFVTGADTNLSVLLFINTNNFMTVYDPEAGACNVLSNDAFGMAVVPISTSAWPRVTVNVNYQTKRAAVFMNGRLLRQQLRLINTNKTNCARLEWDAGTAGSTYVDSLNVWTDAALVTSDDADHDGTADAIEINLNGDVHAWPRGSVFRVR